MSQLRIHVAFAPHLDEDIKPPRNPKERHRMERRLVRIGKRVEESRGTVMNHTWLAWFAHYGDVTKALEGND